MSGDRVHHPRPGSEAIIVVRGVTLIAFILPHLLPGSLTVLASPGVGTGRR